MCYGFGRGDHGNSFARPAAAAPAIRWMHRCGSVTVSSGRFALRHRHVVWLVVCPLGDQSRKAVYQRCTGRQEPPEQPAREGWVVVGRRGGKSRVAALVAVFQGKPIAMMATAGRCHRLAPRARDFPSWPGAYALPKEAGDTTAV
jgi:hypothetical protein